MRSIELGAIQDVTPAAREIQEQRQVILFAIINFPTLGETQLEYFHIALDVAPLRVGGYVIMEGGARMAKSVRIAPTNSLLFISDPDGGDAPAPSRDVRIRSTPTCISVPCLMWQDGETQVTLGAASEVDPGRSPAFDAELVTPNRAILISTVEHQRVLQMPASTTRTRIRIWINRENEPDNVIVGVE